MARGSSDWSRFSLYTLENAQRVFAKSSTASAAASMFAAEAAGLHALAATRTVAVPAVLHHARAADGGGFLLMKHLELQPTFDQAELGRSLARLHSHPCASDRFGFELDNTIGGTPQVNAWCDDWVEFFITRRLQPQLERTRDAEALRLGQLVAARIPSLFLDGVVVRPSLLHGDLWSGNIATSRGAPVIFDPACYFGHSEAEFGMSWCANFSPAFYEAYHSVLPRQPGWEERHRLYTLYHVLNHWNLFGGGYREKAPSLLQMLARSPV